MAVIDEADRLTISSQNALLKTLEEPAGSNVVILVAHDADKILPTIRSRCLIKKFNLVARQEIEAIVPQNHKREDILFWAMGRPGLAKIVMNDESELAWRQELRAELNLVIGGNLAESFPLAESLAKNQESLSPN